MREWLSRAFPCPFCWYPIEIGISASSLFLPASNKYQMKYDEHTGKVSLLISIIGPGDEGEYTCRATNQYGEAVCTVYIQPEGENINV